MTSQANKSVGPTTPTALVTAAQAVRTAGAPLGVLAVALDTNTQTVYLGGDDVTSSTGIPLPAGAAVGLELWGSDSLYAIAASGTQVVRVLTGPFVRFASSTVAASGGGGTVDAVDVDVSSGAWSVLTGPDVQAALDEADNQLADAVHDTDIGTSVQAFSSKIVSPEFGDGSDGAVTISGDTTLTRDMYYSSLTVDAGVVLSTGGFRVYCTGTVTVNGTIQANGNNGSGSASGAASNLSASTPYGSGGSAGGTGAGSTTAATVLLGGLGGAGGAGSGGAGGSTPSATAQPVPPRVPGHMPVSRGTTFVVTAGAGSPGGGNGASSGGGPGSGAGCVYIVALAVVVGAAGVIRANGGAGAAGTASDCGGGGGGGGGLVLIWTKSYTNNGTVQANGGTGGASGGGTGVAGSNGSNGTVQVVTLAA